VDGVGRIALQLSQGIFEVSGQVFLRSGHNATRLTRPKRRSGEPGVATRGHQECVQRSRA
jgi:hypothetical protein